MQVAKQIFLLSTIVCSFALPSIAQETILKFYDSSWIASSKDSAFYVTQNTRVGNLFVKKTYWVDSQKLYAVSTGPDLLQYGKSIGISTVYHKNGMIKDSSYYDEDATLKYKYSYYDNGQLADVIYYGHKWSVDSARHYFNDGALKAQYRNAKKKKDIIARGYTEKGVEIEDFIYGEEADFKGGVDGWRKFLQEYLNPNVPVDRGAPAGAYQVIARFIVEKDGTLSNIRMETSFGYGMEQEVMRILLLSPKWKPAIHLNERAKAYRRQPVTFVISEKR